MNKNKILRITGFAIGFVVAFVVIMLLVKEV